MRETSSFMVVHNVVFLQHFLALEVQILVNLIILETLSKFRSPKLFQAHFNLHIFLRK